MTENTTASGAADLPEFPAHPEPQIMGWGALEIVAIRKYGADMFRAGRLAASASVAPTVEGAIAQLKTALCESKGWAKNYSDALIRDAIDRVEPSPQPAAPQGDGDMLRAHAEGRVTHINNGLCPDIIEGHDTRDPECPVCQALLENHAALPAPPQGAAKEQK